MTTAKLVEITARHNPGLFGRVSHALRQHMLRRAARQQLMNLDDRMLRDIGLTRFNVMSDQF
ncbi:MAG: DUF1127 domain-containing protein [Proteobacteria bacterium]|nr:DUF1127 domain-containing protein [Pseudomonadota bacterium]